MFFFKKIFILSRKQISDIVLKISERQGKCKMKKFIVITLITSNATRYFLNGFKCPKTLKKSRLE